MCRACMYLNMILLSMSSKENRNFSHSRKQLFRIQNVFASLIVNVNLWLGK